MMLVQIAGRLGRDPETRFTQSGLKVTNLTIATNVRKGGKEGKEETVWWRVTIWGDRFDKMMTYLKKGSAVIVVGEMGKPEIYTDKEGRPQVSLELTAEIIRFSPFGNPDRPQEGSSASGANAGASGVSQSQAPYGAEQSFGGDYNSGSQPFSGSSQYGSSSSGQNQGGSRYTQNAEAEDPLPF